MKPLKILMADDDPEDRLIFKEAIEQSGADDGVFFAEDGVDALETLNRCYQQGHVPGLIVLDLNMPKLNGRQTLQQLKSDERFKNIPVVIYSTSINPMEREKCMSLGAHSYVTKPLSFEESLKTAKNFLQFC